MKKSFLRSILLALFSATAFSDQPPDFSLASVYNEPSVFIEGKINRIHVKDINGQNISGQHYPPTWRDISP